MNERQQFEEPTPEWFVAEWDRRPYAERLKMAESILADTRVASRCFVMNHEAKIQRLTETVYRQETALYRARMERAQAEDAETEAKDALARVEALPQQWAFDWRDAPPVDRILRKITTDLALALRGDQ